MVVTLEKQVDKWISDLAGAFTDAIIVYPGGWDDTFPQWLKEAITIDRLLNLMENSESAVHRATDSEVCAYLMTASFCFPFDHDWTEIYMFCLTKTFERHKKDAIPDDIRQDTLNSNQIEDMNRLKSWIYERQVKYRKEKEWAVRAGNKNIATIEEESKHNEATQPSLFEF